MLIVIIILDAILKFSNFKVFIKAEPVMSQETKELTNMVDKEENTLPFKSTMALKLSGNHV